MLRSWWLAAVVFPFPPIVNYATGSDLTELVHKRSIAGMIYRSLVRKAVITVLAPYPEMIKSARRYKIAKSIFIRFPYFMPKPNPRKIEGPIVYFHPSHLDWGASDDGGSRNSTKGNDMFLRAFFRAVKAGADIECLILDRGSDRHLAKQMTDTSGFADHFQWLPALNQREFADAIDACDIVVDQFNVGGFGGIAIEAMSKAKPLMTYIDQDAASLVYGEKPPILNCRTEDDIFDAIMANRDRQALAELGRSAAAWVASNHDDPPEFREFVSDIKRMIGSN